MKTLREQLAAEFIGTLALVFVGAGSVVILSQALGASGIVGIALAHGLVLAVMVSNLGHISGAHFNPAVTVGAWVAGKIESVRAVAYVASQLVGAAAGAALLRWSLPEQLWQGSEPDLGGTGVARNFGITSGKALLIEAILTFFLVITVFAVAVDDRGVFRSIAGLPIGLVLTFDILVGGFLTGASMNPARSFGPALLAADWTDYWIYIIGPVTGAVIAASGYWLLYLRGRDVVSQRTETPIGGGPEEDLPELE